MNVYEIEHNGEIYTVEANSDEEALQLVQSQSQADPTAGVRQFRQQQAEGRPFEDEPSMAGQDEITSGVAEGVARLGGAAKRIGGGLQDMYNMFVKGKPYFDPNAKQYLPPSAYNKAAVEESARQKLSELEAIESGIDPNLRGFAAGAVENAALAAGAEFAGASRATTLTGNMLRQAAAGGAQAAIQSDTDAGDALTDVAVGATLPGLVGAFAGFSQAVRNTVARGIKTRVEGSRTDDAVAGAKAVLPNFEPTLAQRTGIPELKTLEQAAYNSKLVKTYADQNDKLVQDISTVLHQPIAPGQDLDTDFEVTRSIAKGKLDQMVSNRIALWENGMANVRGKIPKTGPKNVPAQHLVQQYVKERADMENVLRNMGTTKLNRRALNELDKVLTPTGKPGFQQPVNAGIGVDSFADLLQGLTKVERDTTDPSVRAFARRMRSAMDKDLKNLASYNGPAKPAVDELLQVRAEYQRAAALERLTKASVTYKLLGVGQKKGTEIPTSDELVSNFEKFSPEKQEKFRIWAQQNSPDILNTMRNKIVRDAVRNSKTITEARDSQVSLSQLTDSLFDAKRGYDIRTSGLWGPVDKAKFEGIKDALRVIENQRTANRGAGTAVKAEDIAINLASRSVPFLSRQTARILFGARAADFLTDPKAYEYLTTIRKTGGPTQLAARMALMEYLQDEYEAAPTDQPSP